MICVLRTGDVEVLGEAAAGGRSGDWCGSVGNMVCWLIDLNILFGCGQGCVWL